MDKSPSSNNPGWIQHALRTAPWRRQSQLVAMIALALSVPIFIGARYLAQATTPATAGRQMEELLAQRERLVREGEQLRAEIADMRSIPRLESRARELGFEEARRDQQQYLVVEGYLPEQVTSVAPLVPEQSTLPDYDETFGGWLQEAWGSLVDQFEAWVGSQTPIQGETQP